MTKTGYFHRLMAQSENRLWINNPTLDEVPKAIEAGAISCTTNPSYTARLLQTESERERVVKIIEELVEAEGIDQDTPAKVQRRVMQPVVEAFKPLYQKSNGKFGFVSIQGDPFLEDDYEQIIAAAYEDRKLGDNVIAKIPATASGLKAMEYLIAENIPIIATEIMAISQVITVCELYQRVSEEKGVSPAFYVTHITGILDEYLQDVVSKNQISINTDALWQAGTVIARKQYQLLKAAKYPVTMLGGGARGLHHFTEMVGSNVHVTINWEGAAAKLIELDPPVVYRMETPTPSYVDELMAKLPDFEKAYQDDGLAIDEYEDYGPVRFFRNSFEKGWSVLQDAIKESGGV